MSKGMRNGLEKWLQAVWYHDGPPTLWLRLLVPAYRLGFIFDRWWGQRKQSARLKGRCIVVVGNLTVGGSGKTPLVIRLCQLLTAAGCKPAVISRGYGRRGKRIVPVTAAASPASAGDEPLVIARRTGVPVLVGENRTTMAMMHFNNGADVVISDDGLQHHRLPRSLEFCVIDGERGFGNGHLLPAGPLREGVQRLADVDYIVVNGGASKSMITSGADNHGAPAHHFMDIIPGLMHSLDGDQSWRLAQFRGCKANAIAGIGNNERFFGLLERAGIIINSRSFPDHHAYTQADFAGLDSDLPIIMTEKDAIKCMDLELKNAWYLIIDAVLGAELEAHIVAAISANLGNGMRGEGTFER